MKTGSCDHRLDVLAERFASNEHRHRGIRWSDVLARLDVRALGGALFGDRRYGRVFVYHNGAQSYYAARGFRGLLHV